MRSVEPTTGPIWVGTGSTCVIGDDITFGEFGVKWGERIEVCIAEVTICFAWAVVYASLVCQGWAWETCWPPPCFSKLKLLYKSNIKYTLELISSLIATKSIQ